MHAHRKTYNESLPHPTSLPLYRSYRHKVNFFSTPEVFTCSKVINAFCINLSKALLTKHEWHSGKCLSLLSHVVIFIPSFHGLR